MSHPVPSSPRPTRPDGPHRPRVLIFDVNETLSDLAPIRDQFATVGLPERLATTWFAGVLRDGFALAAAGTSAPFADIAAESLRSLFTQEHPNRDIDLAVTDIMETFAGLPVHPDVPSGLSALTELDLRLVTLSNGGAAVGETLLQTAGVRDLLEAVLSAEDAGVWKPAPESYAYALRECGVEPQETILVAVHPWDTDGAARAGLASAWINRRGSRYPGYFLNPTLEATSLVDLAVQLSALPST